jgi:hypothetical protein
LVLEVPSRLVPTADGVPDSVPSKLKKKQKHFLMNGRKII